MKNWLSVKWSLFWGWSLILKIGEKKSVNDPYQKSAKRVSFDKDHDPYKIKMSVNEAETDIRMGN